jgi:hypothetical protein
MERQNQNIHIIGMPFSTDLLRLTTPTVMQNGNSHFTRIVFDDSPLYFQTPRCETKQGIVTTTTKKTYYDLVLDSNSETSHSPKEFKAFVEWMQALEDAVIKLLHSNGKLWFRDPLSEDDVRGLFASPLKPLKGGNQLSLRVNVPTSVTRANACTVFDESEKPVHLSYLTPEHHIISIIEVLGVRFTSSSFQLDLSSKQIAVVSKQPLFQNCLIKKDTSVYAAAAPTVTAIPISPMEGVTTNPGTVTSKKEDAGELKPLLETDIVIEQQDPPINIHDPLKIYYSLYKAALKRARDAKRMSIQAFLDAKNIKNKYNLDIYDDDYNDDDENDDDADVDKHSINANDNTVKDGSNHKDSVLDSVSNSESDSESGSDSGSGSGSETSETSGKPPIKIIGNENISISIEEILTSK